MSCEHVRPLILAWSPAGPDLPDEAAAHLDTCAVCSEVWNTRFAPVALPEDAVPVGTAARLVPVPRRRARWAFAGLGGAALAAAAAAALFLPMADRPAPVARSIPQAEGPPPVLRSDPTVAGGEGLVGLKGNRRTVNQVTEGRELVEATRPQLEALGYVQGGADGATNAKNATVRTEGDQLSTLGYIAPSGDAERLPENPVVRTANDRLSTFAMDVDTASYTYARRTLRDGFLPRGDEIRIEEFVNYFAYDYPLPASGAFSMTAESAPSPFTSGQHLVRIGLQGRQVRDRQPVHLTFLIDTSGSMQGDDRIGLVKRSLELLVASLRDGDTVAIVAYAGAAGVVLPPTAATERATLLAAIERLQSGGSTAMGAGLQLAYDLAEQQLRPGSENRVVVASDGDANVGAVRGQDLVGLIRAQADKGITLTTLGFGTGNYRDGTMESLANKGDGNYYYIDSEQEARRVVVDRLTATVTTIARDAKIQVAWDPKAVTSWHLLGYENRALADRDFRNDAVDAGEVGSGHQVTALYEVTLAPGARDLGVVRVRSEAPGPQGTGSEQQFPIEASPRASFGEASRDFRRAAVVAGFAQRLRGEEVSWSWLRSNAAASANPGSAEDRELQELIGLAAALGDPTGQR